MDLHLWCAPLESPKADGSDRVPLPGSPFTVHVSEGMASATGSFVGEAEAGKQGVGFVAGENVLLRPQVRDSYGNAAAAPEGALSAEWVNPGNEGVPGAEKDLGAPKMKGGVGNYELGVEPTKAGVHAVHIKLYGSEITGSPVSFAVSPANPNPQKCFLTRAYPPESEMLFEKVPCGIRVTTVDKYGNRLDRGGVRVDAKAVGISVSPCVVEDHKDGTYMISLTAGAPGDVKVTVRIDSVDIQPFPLLVHKASSSGEDGEEGGEHVVAEDEKKKDEKKDKDKARKKSAAPASAPLREGESVSDAAAEAVETPPASASEASAEEPPPAPSTVGVAFDLTEKPSVGAEAAVDTAAPAPASAKAKGKAKKSPKKAKGK